MAAAEHNNGLLSGEKILDMTIAEDKNTEHIPRNVCCRHCREICPPKGNLAIAMTAMLFMIAIFGFCWGATGDMSLPGGKVFALMLIFFGSYLFGFLATVIHLPDLFGMLISGIILRNLSMFKLEQSLDSEWSSFLRGTALAVILVRAGMGLDPRALRRLSCAVFRLAFAPCIVEICCSAVMSHFLLGLPWNYSFILGSVLAAVSPAVVVPCLLNLSLRGYGLDKGIPTLVIAASSVDDILAISVFGILIGVTFAEGNIIFMALKSPIEIAMGTAYGFLFGCLLWFLPHSQNSQRMSQRFILLLLFALFGLFGSARVGFGGAGPFAALLLGFVVQKRWREEALPDETERDSVSKNFELIWSIAKPFLFGLIGAEVSLSKLELRTIGTGVVVLLVGLLFRMSTTFLVAGGNGLSVKEKIFVTVSWLPKATVQAAIGGVALDVVRQKGGTDEEIENALKIVSVAVLSILVTAPVGAILITNLGPKLLKKSSVPVEQDRVAENQA